MNTDRAKGDGKGNPAQESEDQDDGLVSQSQEPDVRPADAALPRGANPPACGGQASGTLVA